VVAKPTQVEGQPNNPVIPEPVEQWASPDKAVRLGDLQVQVDGVARGKVDLKDVFRGAGQSKDELLVIKLTLTNMNPNKKVEYRSWSGADFSVGRDYATLKDNFGNGYKRITFGLGAGPVGGVERNESIYPNKSQTDVLVFELPVDTATHLDLEMPATNYGGEGFVRFRLPITKQPANKPAPKPGQRPPSKPEPEQDPKPEAPAPPAPKPEEPPASSKASGKAPAPAEKSAPPPVVTITPPRNGVVLLGSSKYVASAAAKSLDAQTRWVKEGEAILLTKPTEVEVLARDTDFCRVRIGAKDWFVATNWMPAEK
jgi:hypothetical protein